MSREKEKQGKLHAIDHLNFRLPCRFYRITYKVAEHRKMPLVSEHMLRLLKALRSISDNDICEFFGLRVDEALHVIKQLMRDNFATYIDGVISITSTGEELFDHFNDDVPAIYKIESHTHDFCFDQISREPVGHDSLSPFTMRLPEVQISDEYKSIRSTDDIASSFKNNFERCLSSLQKLPANARPLHSVLESEWNSRLYGISSIESGDRVSSLVPVIVESKRALTSLDVDISDWSQRIEYTDTNPIRECCHAMIDNVELDRNQSSRCGIDYLRDCSPDSYKQFFREGIPTDKLDTVAYWRKCASKQGELRADQPTAMTFGTFWLERNQEMLLSAFDLADDDVECTNLYWLKPSVSMWGRSAEFLTLHEELCKRMSGTLSNGRPESKLFSLCEDDEVYRTIPWEFGQLFTSIGKLNPGCAPSDFELLLIPDKLFAVNLYTSNEDLEEYPVAFGLISFDPELVSIAWKTLHEIADSSWTDW